MITSVRLSEEDHEFCKKHELQFSDLLRDAIFIRREAIEGCARDNVEELSRKLEAFRKLTEESRTFIEKQGLMDKFLLERGY